MTHSPRPVRSFGRNVLALAIAGSAVGIARINSDPMIVGAEPNAKTVSLAAPSFEMPATPALPQPMEAATAVRTASREADLMPVKEDLSTLHGLWGLKLTSALLEKGCESFRQLPDYTASMYKQERINGVLAEGQTIDLKIRHEPFSVYMKWLSGDRGRQLIYVDGQNDGNLLVQPGGIRGRLTGVLALEPTGSMAMSESRHPITKAGLLALAETLLQYQHADLQRGTGVKCVLQDNQQFEDRPCYLCTTTYDSPEYNASYRKSVAFIDKELLMPLCVKNYTWARDADPEKLDEETLVEFYAYTDLRIQQQLGHADFDQNNKGYRLRIKR